MSVDDVAVGVGRALEAARLGVRTFLPVDTNRVPGEWAHITKVDPEGAKRLPLLYPLYLRHTSAVSVGGSADVTAENTEETFRLLEYSPVPNIHEPSGPRHVTDATREAAYFLAVPEVLNGDSESLVGTLGAGAEYIRDKLVASEIDRKVGWLPGSLRDRLADFATSWLLADAVFEAYIIQNPDSAAAREANVDGEDTLEAAEAGRRALAAEKRLESDLIYLEYSGTFGGADAEAELRAIDDATRWSRVWYGGGLDSREQVDRILAAGADAVVVGDIFHEVAEEEAALRSAAREEFPADADPGDIREWVDAEVAPPESAAARYLSTCQVPDPGRTAREYLAASVDVALGLEALADEDPRDAIAARETLPGEEALAWAVDPDAARELAEEYVRAELREVSDEAFAHVGLFGEPGE